VTETTRPGAVRLLDRFYRPPAGSNEISECVEEFCVAAPVALRLSEVADLAAVRSLVRGCQHPADHKRAGARGAQRPKEAILHVVVDVADVLILHSPLSGVAQ